MEDYIFSNCGGRYLGQHDSNGITAIWGWYKSGRHTAIRHRKHLGMHYVYSYNRNLIGTDCVTMPWDNKQYSEHIVKGLFE